MFAIAPTYFAPNVRGALPGISTIQDVTQLEYNQTLDVNLSSGPQIITADEIYQFEHTSPTSINLRVNISASQSVYSLDLLLSVRSDTRQILSSTNTAKYPTDKIDLFLSNDNSSTQMSALVHELYYAGHVNDSVFTFSGEETGQYDGNAITVRRYDAANQYVCST